MSPEEQDAVQKMLQERPDLLRAFGLDESMRLIFFPQFATVAEPDEALYWLAAMADEVCMVRTGARKNQK